MFLARMAIFGLDAVPQMSSCRHVVDGHGHCRQQASGMRNGCYVDKTYKSVSS